MKYLKVMNDFLGKYFSGELTDKEKEDFFLFLNRTPALKDEFLEIQNVLGLTGFLPRNSDSSEAKISLSRFIKNQRKKITK